MAARSLQASRPGLGISEVKAFPRGFGSEPLQNLPFVARARHGQPSDFRPQGIFFSLCPACRPTVPALLQPGRETAKNYSRHRGQKHDYIERSINLGSFGRWTGERIKENGHQMPVGHCQGQNNKRDRDEEKIFEEPPHLRSPMPSHPLIARLLLNDFSRVGKIHGCGSRENTGLKRNRFPIEGRTHLHDRANRTLGFAWEGSKA